MNRSARSYAARVALCTTFGCNAEVTLHFFDNDTAGVEVADAGDGGLDSCRKLGAEVCNGADDDCNGKVDEGCDYKIVWTAQPDGAALGHAADGVSFTAACPDGTVLTGLRVGFGESLNQVAAVCRQIGVDVEGADGATTYSLTVGPRFDKAFAPAVSLDPQNQLADLLCPGDLVASMLEGDDDLARHILDIGIRCAPMIVSTQAGNAILDLNRSQEVAVGPLACSTCTAPANYKFASPVPPGQVAKRLFGGVGALVYRVGFGPSAATITSR
jgi:hypothetical protein